MAEETNQDDTKQPERHRLSKIGIVVSNKMTNTVTVRVDRLTQHPVYKRSVRRSKKFHAHDASDAIQIGDKVTIVESRPMSKNKRWRVQSVIEKAKS